MSTSRRDKPGLVEVHARETDIFHFLEGTAMVVTGGKVVNGKATAPGEIRGSDIQGGDTHRVSKGDVLVIPEGVPHWFKEVGGPVLYYVVKSISNGRDK